MWQGAELLCTCPQPPAPPTPGPPDSYGIATAAILPPPPSFTGGQASQPQVTTVPVTKVRTEDAANIAADDNMLHSAVPGRRGSVLRDAPSQHAAPRPGGGGGGAGGGGAAGAIL